MSWLTDLINQFRRLFIWFVMVPPWEQGIRVRLGSRVKRLGPGVHFAIPFIDEVYNQNVRIHVVDAPNQTLTTADSKVITISMAVGFSIKDMLAVYKQVNKPDSVILAAALGRASEVVRTMDSTECTPDVIEEEVRAQLEHTIHGIKLHQVNVTDFAYLKAYRLVNETGQRFYADGYEVMGRKVTGASR